MPLGPIPSAELVLSWARDLYKQSVDRKDASGFARAFTHEATLRFGNAEPLKGRVAIEAAIAQFFETFATLQHQEKGAWLIDGTLVLEALVTYQRHDERKVSVPAVTIFRVAGSAADDPARPVVDDCRIYVDLTPLYSPL